MVTFPSLQEYLKKYSNLNPRLSAGLMFTDEDFTAGVKAFQKMAGINITGQNL